jgi:hypothetical protein
MPRQKSTNPFDDDATIEPSTAMPPTCRNPFDDYEIGSSTFRGVNPIAGRDGHESMEADERRRAAYAMRHFIPTRQPQYVGLSSNSDNSGKTDLRRNDKQRTGFRSAVRRIDRQIAQGGVESSIVAYENANENAVIRFLVSQRGGCQLIFSDGPHR